MRRLASDGLIARGLDVTEARSAGEGDDILSWAHAFDLLVVDFALPDRLGLTFAEQVRSTSPRIPVLFITNRSDPLEMLEDQIAGQGFARPFGVMRIPSDGFPVKRQHVALVESYGQI